MEIERSLVQCEQSVRHRRIVLEIAIDLRRAVLVNPPHAAVTPHLIEEKLTISLRRRPILRALQGSDGLRKRAQHQPVPSREYLVVACGRHALLPGRE